MTVTTSVPEAPRGDTRELRALELFRSRGHEIRRTGPHTYLVPSCTGEHLYRVDYAVESCECDDHARRRVNCKHILCVGVLVSKRRAARAKIWAACDGCGRRCRRSELAEVVESLTYHPGDILCGGCAASSDAETL